MVWVDEDVRSGVWVGDGIYEGVGCGWVRV